MKLQSITFITGLVIFTSLISCKPKRPIPDISNIPVKISIQRFDKDLFSIDFDHIKDSVPYLKKKYGEFFDIFNYKIVKLGNTANPEYPDLLKGFVTDYLMNEIFKKVDSTFRNMDDIESKLTSSFKFYKYYFPDMKIPRVYTYISGFNQSVVTSDTILGIGLDKYLGPSSRFYSKLGLPSYMRYNMRKEKIPSDCVRGWGLTQFEMPDSAVNLLSNMIYQGKILYFTKSLLPNEPDSLIIGFSEKHISWCKKYEKEMWTYLVENKKLFSSDYLLISKYINEGPFTKDFSRDSPARAAVWIGWRIVTEYMNKNQDVTLKSLMTDNDYQKILRLSRYRP